MTEHWIRTHNHDGDNSAEIEAVPEAPEDGKTYGRKDAAWAATLNEPTLGAEVVVINQSHSSFAGPLTFNFIIQSPPANIMGLCAVEISATRTSGSTGSTSNTLRITADPGSSTGTTSWATVCYLSGAGTITRTVILPIGRYRIYSVISGTANFTIRAAYKWFDFGITY